MGPRAIPRSKNTLAVPDAAPRSPGFAVAKIAEKNAGVLIVTPSAKIAAPRTIPIALRPQRDDHQSTSDDRQRDRTQEQCWKSINNPSERQPAGHYNQAVHEQWCARRHEPDRLGLQCTEGEEHTHRDH